MKTIELDVPEYGFINNGKNIDNPINEILTKYSILQTENQRLNKENIKLKSEHYKDEELQRLKKENEELREATLRGFSVTKSEHKAILRWQAEHNCKCHNGGISNYRFDIIPGIGYNGYVTCSCGEEFCFYQE